MGNLEFALSKAKTVAKSGYFHGNDNVILTFRSMEILIECEGDDNELKQRKFSPIYVPVDIVYKLYRFNTKELLKLLFDHVTFSKNSSVRMDLNRLRMYLEEYSKKSNGPEYMTPEDGRLRTSYMYQN